jgi:hypothetical protein
MITLCATDNACLIRLIAKEITTVRPGVWHHPQLAKR